LTNTNSKRVVLDSWAWIAYFDGTEAGERVDEAISDSEVFTSPVSIAEVVSKAERKGKDAGEAFDFMVSLSKTVEMDAGFAKEVGRLHAALKRSRPNLSLADAFALQTARSLNARLLTGDPDFEGMKEAEMLK
jgi:predicted nucleic acid-binding protein